MKRHIVVVLCLLTAVAATAEVPFSPGLPVQMEPGMSLIFLQEGSPVLSDTARVALRHDPAAGAYAARGDRQWGTSIGLMVAGGATLVGGLVTLLVGTSGIAEEGTMPVLATSVGLNLASVGCWVGFVVLRLGANKSYQSACEAYNAALEGG